jgi:large subunit ribosomal protein L27
VKKFGGHEVYPNDILARQRGWFWRPGNNTYTGKDHTIHAQKEGNYINVIFSLVNSLYN